MSIYTLARDRDTHGLLELVDGSDSPAVRRRASKVLGDLGVDEEDVVRGLVRAAQEDDDEHVRAAAIDALDDLGRDAIEQLLVDMTGGDFGTDADWVTAKRFVQALSAESPELRMAAASGLGRIGDEAAVPPLIETLSDPDPRVRERAGATLGRIGDPRAVDALTDRLDDEYDPVRRAAADALAGVGGERALEPLRELLDDDSELIRQIAADALGNARSVEPVADLVDVLGDESDAVRRTAVFSIIELLSNAPASQSHQVRERVVEQLQAVDEDVTAPLVEILESGTQGAQRRNAAWLVGKVAGGDADQHVVDALVSVLDDEDPNAARFAATSLADVGGEAVEDSLLDVLDDADASSEARAKATFVLGQVGGERSRERLSELTSDDADKKVRKRAFAALSKLGGRV